MRIFMQTTYYYPHVSGLTLYFQRLAEEYVKLGHKVTMVAAQHDRSLPLRENIAGVDVIRTPYLFKLNKGLFLPKIIFDSWKAIKECDVVHFNLPAIEAFQLIFIARLLRKKVVSTYVCDIVLPKLLGAKILGAFIDLIHLIILQLSHEIASYTIDFAKNSRILKYFTKRTKEIYPPLELPVKPKPISIIAKLRKSKIKPLIGMATRISAEKGIDLVLKILSKLQKKFPNLKLVIAGEINAVGEEKYLNKIRPLLNKLKNEVILLGRLSPAEMVTFYKNLDLLIVASINSTEAFGMVQVEAMSYGCPVVATNLPGVRIPVKITGMGKITKIGNKNDLYQKIITILSHKKKFTRNTKEVKKLFSLKKTISQYLSLYH